MEEQEVIILHGNLTPVCLLCLLLAPFTAEATVYTVHSAQCTQPQPHSTTTHATLATRSFAAGGWEQIVPLGQWKHYLRFGQEAGLTVSSSTTELTTMAGLVESG